MFRFRVKHAQNLESLSVLVLEGEVVSGESAEGDNMRIISDKVDVCARLIGVGRLKRCSEDPRFSWVSLTFASMDVDCASLMRCGIVESA